MLLFVTILMNGCGGKEEAKTGAAIPVEMGVLRVLDTNPRWLTDDTGKAR
jgi:hypothetical protein